MCPNSRRHPCEYKVIGSMAHKECLREMLRLMAALSVPMLLHAADADAAAV